MKKLFLSVFALFIISSVSFSQDKTNLGTSVGLNFSLLGIAPTITLDYSHFEFDSKIYFSINSNSKRFAVAPAFSLGYNTNPFKRGYQNFIGSSYILITGGWIDGLLKFSKPQAENENFNIHLIGVTYNGAYQWNNGLNLNFGYTIPIGLISTTKESTSSLWIFSDFTEMAACLVSGLLTINIGLKYFF